MAKPDRPTLPRPSHSLWRAAVDLPLRAAAVAARGKDRSSPGDLPPALAAERHEVDTAAGRLSFYVAGVSADAPPLLLIHSVNAAASAYEVKPLFEAWRERRTVYALDLPGFGFSERSPRVYEPRLMTEAVLAIVDEILRRHGPGAIDALALSLSSEFLARAAAERPALFRSLAFVSPTGFDARAPWNGPPGTTRARPRFYRTVTFGLWRTAFFRLLTSRVGIRYFLEKTWGSKAIDEGLADYDYRTARRPGAEHAPFCFISGFLFSNDITHVHERLSMPVWLIHGTRGDFTDYGYTSAFETRDNWSVETFETGALPQFEQPDRVNERYAAFLSGTRVTDAAL